LAVFDDVSQGVVEQEDIWVSCYQAGKTSVHGKAKIRKGDKPNDVDVLSREGVEVSRTSRVSWFWLRVPLFDLPLTVSSSVEGIYRVFSISGHHIYYSSLPSACHTAGEGQGIDGK
jgi:hypothetical protein